jgi:regulator of protease activity HflC (stomatin/prohibitin superfamily)
MEILNTIVQFISKLFQWWYTVMPWEQAVHVRMGSRQHVRAAGMYFKIPFVDTVYVQTSRMRMMDVPMQTMSTKDGLTITVKICLGYSISDVQLLFSTLTHPEMTLGSMAQGFVGDYIRKSNAAQLNPAEAETYVSQHLNGENYGLSGITIKVTTFAIVKTFRLMQDNAQLYNTMSLDNKL